jgi:hypothetical protein
VVQVQWAFWRRRKTQARPDPPQPPSGQPPNAPPATAAARPSRPSPEDADDRRRATPAFSGASPRPGEGDPGGELAELLAEGGDDLSGLLSSAWPHLDVAGVRADVVRLVQAVLERDAAAVAALLAQLEARGAQAVDLAPVLAMAALGDRLGTAAGLEPWEAADRAAEVVAQGDTVAARADGLLRSVAPHAPRGRVRLVVRTAAGVPAADRAVAQHLADPPADLTVAAAVLLAQTVVDGGGDLDALAAELADLLPG